MTDYEKTPGEALAAAASLSRDYWIRFYSVKLLQEWFSKGEIEGFRVYRAEAIEKAVTAATDLIDEIERREKPNEPR